MTDRNDPLLREINEELRRERYAKLWDQYGLFAIGAVVALLLLVAGYQIMSARQRDAAEAAGRAYEQALEQVKSDKKADALGAFETLAKGGPSGYAALSRLQLAGQLGADGKTAEAVAAFEALAADESSDPLLRDFARLQAASLRLGDADWTEMQNRLNGLVADGNDWRLLAREVWGVAALKAGKLDEARRAFEQILAERAAPPDLAERARTMMAILVAREGPSPPKPAPASPDTGATQK